MPRKKPSNAVVSVHARLFVEDVVRLKQLADTNGSKWHIELRQLVRRALKGERREVLVLKEQA